MSATSEPAIPALPPGSNTINSFIFTDDAAGLMAFLVDVFGATDVPGARTNDTDGLILHSELKIGDSLLMVADRKPEWPYTPAFTRVYVDDVDATLERAMAHGARVVTEPTDFWGDVFSRFADPYGHLWWVWKHNSAAWQGEPADDADESGTWSEADSGGSWESYTTPELEYIHSSLLDAIGALRDPRTSAG